MSEIESTFRPGLRTMPVTLRFSVRRMVAVVGLALCFGLPLLRADLSGKNLTLVEFEETPISEAMEFFRVRSAELDPEGKGINIVFDKGVDQQREVSLRLREVPIKVALIHFFDHAGLDYRIDSHACFVLPGGSANVAAHPAPGPAAIAYAAKATRLKLDHIEFAEAPLSVVIRHLADRSAKLDQDGAGINLVLGAGVEPQLPVSMALSNVALSDVVRNVAEQTGLAIRLAPGAIFLEYPLPKVTQARKGENTASNRGDQGDKNKRSTTSRTSALGGIPNDPRSTAHPDYVSSMHPDPSKRTNALGNSYKWVNGRWTFVRYVGGLQEREEKKVESATRLDSVPRRN